MCPLLESPHGALRSSPSIVIHSGALHLRVPDRAACRHETSHIGLAGACLDSRLGRQ
jgi:hypothetical protein